MYRKTSSTNWLYFTEIVRRNVLFIKVYNTETDVKQKRF